MVLVIIVRKSRHPVMEINIARHHHTKVHQTKINIVAHHLPSIALHQVPLNTVMEVPQALQNTKMEAQALQNIAAQVALSIVAQVLQRIKKEAHLLTRMVALVPVSIEMATAVVVQVSIKTAAVAVQANIEMGVVLIKIRMGNPVAPLVKIKMDTEAAVLANMAAVAPLVKIKMDTEAAVLANMEAVAALASIVLAQALVRTKTKIKIHHHHLASIKMAVVLVVARNIVTAVVVAKIKTDTNLQPHHLLVKIKANPHHLPLPNTKMDINPHLHQKVNLGTKI